MRHGTTRTALYLAVHRAAFGDDDGDPGGTDTGADPGEQAPPPAEAPMSPMQRRNQRMSAVVDKRAEEIEAGQADAVDHRIVDTAAAYGDQGIEEEGEEPPADASDDSGAGDDAGTTQESDESGEAASDDSQPPHATTLEPDQLPERLTLKVDGELVTLTGEQVRTALQKDLYGDRRLREAAQISKDLETRQAQIEARERELQAEQTPPEGETDQLEATTAALNTLLDGNVEEAAKLLTDITSQGRTATADSTPQADDLVEQAATRVKETLAAEEFEEDLNQGWADFQKEYPEIAGDDVLLSGADVVIKRLQEQHPGWKPSKIIMEAGKEINERFVNPPPAPSASEDEQRLDRKRNLKPIPQGQGTARKEEESEPEVDRSPHGAIQRMAASRAVVR